MTLVSDPDPLDNTLNQTVGEQMRAEELSLRATVPPAQVPGYRLDRLLGQGAFGQVWVGNNLNTGRTVAIKFYLHRSIVIEFRLDVPSDTSLGSFAWEERPASLGSQEESVRTPISEAIRLQPHRRTR